MYRIICRFVPSVRYTPTGGRFSGSWRVVACLPRSDTSMAISKSVLCLSNLVPQLLVISAVRPAQPNSWCSPRKILDTWLARRRNERQLAGYRQATREYFQRPGAVI